MLKLHSSSRAPDAGHHHRAGGDLRPNLRSEGDEDCGWFPVLRIRRPKIFVFCSWCEHRWCWELSFSFDDNKISYYFRHRKKRKTILKLSILLFSNSETKRKCRIQNFDTPRAVQGGAAHEGAAKRSWVGLARVLTGRFANETTVPLAPQGIVCNCPGRSQQARTNDLLLEPAGESKMSVM